MDINGDGSKLVILVNESRFGTPMLGETYSAYAHVSAPATAATCTTPPTTRADHTVYGSVHRISPAPARPRRGKT